MKNIILFSLLLFCQLVPIAAQESISLEGEWAFRLDPENIGMTEKWFTQTLPDKVHLPGSLDEQGIGTPPQDINLGKLTSDTRYVGVAWYQKEIVVPDNWENKNISLLLERANWETQVFVDGFYYDTRNSISVPQIYDLSDLLPPGKHILTIRLNNTVKINIGHTLGNMLWSHAVSEETQTNWNGIIGEIKLIASPPVWIKDIQIYPDFNGKITKITVVIGNHTGSVAKGVLNLATLPDGESVEKMKFSIEKNSKDIKVELPFGNSPRYWDDLSPQLYKLNVSIESGVFNDTKSINIGLRDFKASGHHFELNDRIIFLRGKVCSAVFPQTGYPPMTLEKWRTMLGIYKNYGINHVRFHSWCPPEAAFTAADELGLILQIEPPLWDGYGMVGSIPERAAFILMEADRIIDTYGHHPSFCLMSMGNELGRGDDPYLAYLLNYLREKDSRHLYTSTTHPPGLKRSDEFFVGAATEQGVTRGIRPFDDFRNSLSGLKRPLIAHELGQPAMYPNYKERDKYTGHLKPKYFDIFEKSLKDNHLLHLAEDFRLASGALLVEIYKENIEAQLRTPNVAGFQMLDLQDYPGHGMAVIGILDAFLDSKGLITPDQFRQFCSPTVPIIRMKAFTWQNDEEFKARAEIVHYGKDDLINQQVGWTISNTSGKKIGSGKFEKRDIPTGGTTSFGEFKMNLGKVKKPEQLLVEISLTDTEIINSWKIWVYPAKVNTIIPDDITVSKTWDKATKEILSNGGNVLLIPEPETLKNTEESRWNPVFWSYQLFKQPVTMGILCDPDHPMLADFPTAFHSDWQWKDLLDHSEALVLDDAPAGFLPIVQFIPDFNINKKLSAILEANVGKGKLIICTIDLMNELVDSPEADQLLKSIVSYMDSNKFQPEHSLKLENLDQILAIVEVSKNQSDKPDVENAVLNIRAAVTATVGSTDKWSIKDNSDEIITMKSGFNYSIEGNSWRDASSSAWFNKHLAIRIQCPSDFTGDFYVFFHDSNKQKRSAALFFTGKDCGPLPRYDKKGVWLKFPVTSEMASSGELTLDTNVTGGPNVTISQIILIPGKQ